MENKIFMGLFDAAYYTSHYQDVQSSGMTAWDHYNTIGWQKNYDPSPYFNTSYYFYKNNSKILPVLLVFD